MDKKTSNHETNKLELAIKNKSQHALAELINNYSKPLNIRAYNILHNREDAEEAVMTAFNTVWQKIDKWNPEKGSFISWANTIVYHCIINKINTAWGYVFRGQGHSLL